MTRTKKNWKLLIKPTSLLISINWLSKDDLKEKRRMDQ
jgi:hypothetical protein